MSPNNFYGPGVDRALAAIFSIEGCALSEDERSFFREVNPFGFILFTRNCETPTQLRKLTDELKETLGRDCPVLIDQEGGRVQRLKPPIWRSYPSMRHYGERAEKAQEQSLEELRFSTLQLAEELVDVGINVNCAPVLDVLTPETHVAIGDRAFSADPERVGRLGTCVARNLLAAGVTPVIKHLPGHGRATLDSHKDLPRVNSSVAELMRYDFEPFRIVSESDIGKEVWGMVAHVLFETIDPQLPSSLSPAVLQNIIRNTIGFEGFMLSDDLDMEALSAFGDVPRRAHMCLEAGCDAALYCAGELSVMKKLAESVPNLGQKALKRLQKSAESHKVAAR